MFSVWLTLNRKPGAKVTNSPLPWTTHRRFLLLHMPDDKAAGVLGDLQMLRKAVAAMRVGAGNPGAGRLLVEGRLGRGAVAEIAEHPLAGTELETVLENRNPAIRGLAAQADVELLAIAII